MSAFLQLVAHDLLRKYHNDLSRIVVVFPNKRASLFLNDYLVQDAATPIWAPSYITINELFQSLGRWQINDPIDTVCRVAQFYKEETHDDVSLDNFYGWAERILSDFDDVDKNMADAGQLFRNLQDLREIEQNDFLTEEQVAVLRKFFSDFDPHNQSEIRQRYSRLWNALLPIYTKLNEELAQENKAYEGAAFRDAVLRLRSGKTSLPDHVEKYVFVGFNVLDKVERALFSTLQDMGKAAFYWDYDRYYLPTAADRKAELAAQLAATERGELRPFYAEPVEAAKFLLENLRDFPNELSEEHFDNLRHIEHMEMVAASTESMQVQSVAPWLQKNLTTDPKRTAVVLCNESLLQPLLHALPPEIEDVNVTKGYPLNHTSAATLVERELARAEQNATLLSANEVLEGIIRRLTDEAKVLVGAEDFDLTRFDHVLQSEAYAQMDALLHRILQVAKAGRLEVLPATLRRIVRQVVRQSVIPFAGEPAVGLQVMGVLETRCLDFEHIIMLSVNEGALPQKANDNSFIPYLLRKAYELVTPERRTAVYAYYFYRLIQRAKRVRLLYNSSSDGIVAGEKSRFLTQLMVESDLNIKHVTLNSTPEGVVAAPEAKTKPQNLLDRLCRKKGSDDETYDDHPSLSPSAINTYMRCPLSFYYKYVEGIKEATPKSDEVQPNTLGTIFHNAAEAIYKELKMAQNGRDNKTFFSALEKNDARLDHFINAAIERTKQDTHAQVVTTPYLVSVVRLFLKSLLHYDREHADFRVLGLEEKHELQLPLPGEGKYGYIKIGGYVDRLDEIVVNGERHLRIVDYKTGGKEQRAKSIDEIFDKRGKDQLNYMLQTFIYAEAVQTERQKNPGKYADLPIAPTLFFVHRSRAKDYSPYLKVEKGEIMDFEQQVPEFRERLAQLVSEILDTSQPFTPVADCDKPEGTCKLCAYRALCHQ